MSRIRLTVVLSVLAWSLDAGAEPLVTVVASDATAAEAGSTGEFTFLLSEAAPDGGLTLSYETAGTAQPSQGKTGDYTTLSGRLEVPAGAQLVRLPVTPNLDQVTEGTETVSLQLTAGRGYAVGEPGQATVSIVDASSVQPMPVVSLEATTPVFREGEPEPGRITIRLNSPARSPLSVRFRIDGSASGDDYQPSAEALITVAAGADSGSITFSAVDDDVTEALQETVRVSLLAGDGYTLSSAAAVVQLILEDNETRAGNAAGAPGIVSRIDGLTERTAGLDETLIIGATVRDSDGNPISGVAIQWTLDDAGAAAGGQLSAADNFTNAGGEARVSLRTASQPAVYRVSIEAVGNAEATVRQTFIVTAGLIDSTRPHTPQAAVARALDTLCPRLAQSEAELTAPQRALLQRCEALINASKTGEDDDVSAALRALAPEETAAQRSLGVRVTNQQLQNIAARLAALRHGSTGVALSGLTLHVGEEMLPAAVFTQGLENAWRGGVAGDAIGDDGSNGLWVDEQWGFFLSGRLGNGSKERTDNESGFDFNTDGLTAGVDYRYSPRTVVGAALGFARTDAEVEANGGAIESDGFSLSAYSTYYWNERGFFDAVLSYANNDFTHTRNIAYLADGVNTQRSGRGDTSGNQLAWSLGTGYEMAAVWGLDTEFFARMDYLNASVDGYTESGAEELALIVAEQAFDSIVLSVGTGVAKAFAQTWGVLLPQATLSWEYDISDAYPIAARFLHDPNGIEFSFDSDTPDQSALRAGLGVSALLRAGTTLFLAWDTVLGRDAYNEHEWSAGARFARTF